LAFVDPLNLAIEATEELGKPVMVHIDLPPLLDLNPNSNLPPPTDHGEMVPLWYSFDLVKNRTQSPWLHPPEPSIRQLPMCAI
jgi:hypothetical protein